LREAGFVNPPELRRAPMVVRIAAVGIIDLRVLSFESLVFSCFSLHPVWADKSCP